MHVQTIPFIRILPSPNIIVIHFMRNFSIDHGDNETYEGSLQLIIEMFML